MSATDADIVFREFAVAAVAERLHSSAMMPPSGFLAPRLRRSAPLLIGIGVMTLLFTAQEIVRNIATGAAPHVGRALVFNLIDWSIWGLIAIGVLAAARRYRLDGAAPLLARIAVWFAVGVVSCLAQSLAAGYLIFTLGVLPTAGAGLGASPPLTAVLARWVISTSGLNILVFLMITGLSHALLYYDDLRSRRLRELDLQAQLAQGELKMLRMQLQPHFLFNALHTVSSLMITDIAAAHRVIAAIGDLLRWSIDHTAAQEVSLRRELEFADRYLEVQQARFRERLSVDRDIDAGCLDALVPSLVLQPLLENAIRHGIEPSPSGGTIRISAAHVGDSLVLGVEDDAPEVPRPASALLGSSAGGGIGLSNIRRRLEQLYGPRQQFESGRRTPAGYAVNLTIPFHSDDQLYPAATHGP